MKLKSVEVPPKPQEKTKQTYTLGIEKSRDSNLLKKIESLDFFQRNKVKNFKSPISTQSYQSFFQYDIDFDKFTPLYTQSIKNFFNTQYTVSLQIGSSRDPFRFIIDTGSGTTLINDKRCASEGCTERKAFDFMKSDSYSSLN